jgi:hypothetical protein
VFSVEQRDEARTAVLEMASRDPRVTAAAVVGSMADGPGDRWSDLDLTFAVVDGVPIEDVLGDWTQELDKRLDATVLFDLPVQQTIYRVFLLPGNLQVDLSFTPAAQFRPHGPRFRLLFGEAREPVHDPPPSPGHLFGLAVHHAVRAWVCIERTRYWQAAYWIDEMRGYALTLACLRRGLNPSYGRGFDDLPPEVLAPFAEALVTAIEREPLLRALRAGVDGLLRESAQAGDVASRVAPRLRELVGA